MLAICVANLLLARVRSIWLHIDDSRFVERVPRNGFEARWIGRKRCNCVE